MSNRRLLDRMVTPEWMNTALRIAREEKPHVEARRQLEIALRDEIESKENRKKTGSILAGSWLAPAEEADVLVRWGRDHASGDLRVWHLGVMLANYAFFDDICASIGRVSATDGDIDTRALRASMKGVWGDKENVNVATRSSVRTLRAFGVLGGDEGDSSSELADRLPVDRDILPWIIHALLVSRGIREIDLREAMSAPELFMFDLPASFDNGYPNIERFVEGSGRVVIGIVERHGAAAAPVRQMELGIVDERR
jgi:hypothetical protein